MYDTNHLTKPAFRVMIGHHTVPINDAFAIYGI
jgi:hypothetical protein